MISLITLAYIQMYILAIIIVVLPVLYWFYYSKLWCRMFGHKFLRIYVSFISAEEMWECVHCKVMATSTWDDKLGKTINFKINGDKK